MAPPSKYTEAMPQMLIDHMKGGLSYESFAGVAGVSRATLYNWESDKEEFKAAKEIGEAMSLLWWEKLGLAAMVGANITLPNGQKLDFKKFNATVWIFSMKNRFGWRDRAPEDNGDKGEPLVIELPTAGKKIVIAQPGQTVPKGIN